MAILVSCSCGKRFRVKDDRAGKRGRCPECQTTLVVPSPRLEPDDDPDPEIDAFLADGRIGDDPFPVELFDVPAADLGIDLSTDPGIAPTARAMAEDKPAPIEGEMPATPDKPPASVVPAPNRPTPYRIEGEATRVVLVGIKLPFDDVFAIVFKVWLATFLLAIVIAIGLGIVTLVWVMFLSVVQH